MIVHFLEDMSTSVENPPRQNNDISLFHVGEVWEAWFPYEDVNRYDKHPCVILGIKDDLINIVASRTTSHLSRTVDFTEEIPLMDWAEAGLDRASILIARFHPVLHKDLFIRKFGMVTDSDWGNIKRKIQDISLPKKIFRAE